MGVLVEIFFLSPQVFIFPRAFQRERIRGPRFSARRSVLVSCPPQNNLIPSVSPAQIPIVRDDDETPLRAPPSARVSGAFITCFRGTLSHPLSPFFMMSCLFFFLVVWIVTRRPPSIPSSFYKRTSLSAPPGRPLRARVSSSYFSHRRRTPADIHGLLSCCPFPC